MTDGGQVDGQADPSAHISTIIASQYRLATVRTLHSMPATPSTIAAETGIGMAHISRALTELREDGIVALEVPEETTRGRLYGLTDAGERVVDQYSDVIDRQYDRNGGDA